ncbi:hypothetical protein GGR58DRAFT_268163 [Xylaria digitata]|nr:hypothetical protein GGR58DRAFT_268163 [Xylaria digitata]
MEHEAEYWSHLESTQRQWYPDFIRLLSDQIGAEQDKRQVAVITFQDRARPLTQVFSKSKDLRRYFDRAPISPPPCEPECRRLFVLEGLPKKFIQLLGSRLQVPPSFFAAHCPRTGKFVGSLLNQSLRNQNSQSRFTLIFPRLHWAKIQEETSNDVYPVYFMQSSITRQIYHITLFKGLKGPLWGVERASFWSAHERQSGDALLLVDPPLGDFVMRPGNPVPRLVIHQNPESVNPRDIMEVSLSQSGSWYPPFSANSAGEVPGMKSMFDDVVNLYKARKCQSTADPKICTDICRQLVLSAWTARLRVMEAEVIRKQYQMSISSTTSTIDYRTWLDKSWTQPWKEREFGGLVRAKSVLETTSTNLFYNMDALGIGGRSPVGEEWETDAWKSLQNAILTLKTRVDIMSEAYTQAVSVRESIVANTQARQVGYLTSLATLFVPVSFIAAVFSMGGEYAAGQQRFYVFWAVSLPVVVVASCIYFFGDYILSVLPKRSIRNQKEQYIV